MKITIELHDVLEFEKLLVILKTLKFENINIETFDMCIPKIRRGNKRLNPRKLFGIWKNKTRTLEEIRVNAWKRNWNL